MRRRGAGVLALHSPKVSSGQTLGLASYDFLDRRRGVQQRRAGAGQDIADRASLIDSEKSSFIHSAGCSMPMARA